MLHLQSSTTKETIEEEETNFAFKPKHSPEIIERLVKAQKVLEASTIAVRNKTKQQQEKKTARQAREKAAAAAAEKTFKEAQNAVPKLPGTQE